MNEKGGIASQPSPHRLVRDAFDEIADRFDESFENDLTVAFRNRLYDEICSLAPRGSRILDINCGTGIDALNMAQRGYQVTGCDISPQMILRAREKAGRAAVSGMQFHVVSFEELRKVFSEPFDVVVSNFGGLNCVADLHATVDQVSSLLRPNGFFLAVVMPPMSPWDAVAALSRGRFRSVFFRYGNNVQATGFSGKTFTVHYHSLKTFRRVCNNAFGFHHARGINILTPPPHATSFAKKHPRVCSFLDSFEQIIDTWPVVRSVGDHYLAVFQRRPHSRAGMNG